ncbi:MAG: RHS repeat domain-containing protein, partial [Solirubrobacterales bacterium]
EYSYDAADRLLGSELTYDGFGRITSLPGAYAGGKTLTTSYFSNDMVASQSQNGITNTFQLDAGLRQRQRLQGGGGLEGAEIFHYDGPSDSPAYTERGSVFTRNIAEIGGELAEIQEGSEFKLQLTNLHGDVVATASRSLVNGKILATYRYDEFGNPVSGSAGRFGWLGGKQRRTELASGVIQMGKRSYVPEMGRFISTDPVHGGSANAYDYVNADPVNGYDLNGEWPTPKSVRRMLRRAVRNANRNRNLILPVIICHHCSKERNALEEAEHLSSEWGKPVRHWVRDKAEELADTVKGAASSIPCRKIGLALAGTGVVLGAAGLATVWIPGVGETLLMAGAGVDLAGVGADMAHEKGMC